MYFGLAHWQCYVVWVLCILAVLGNAFVLIWKIAKRSWRSSHSLLVANMAAADSLTSAHLLIITFQNLVPSATHLKGWRLIDQHVVCKIGEFLNKVGYEVSVATILMLVIDRLKCARDPLKSVGIPLKRKLLSLVFIWVAASGIAAVPFVPINYFKQNGDFNQSENNGCFTLVDMAHLRNGWEFTFGVHIGINACMYVVMVAMTGELIYRACAGQNAAEGSEMSYLKKTLALCYVQFICWVPCLVIAHSTLSLAWTSTAGLSRDAVEWLALVSSTAHASFNPIIYLCASVEKRVPVRSLDVVFNYSESGSETTAWKQRRSERVSIRLTSFLASRDALTPQEAMLMTSSLNSTVLRFHKLGMAASAIDPEHIVVEQDSEGNVIRSRLVGVPVKPPPDALENHIQQDKNAIGQLFDTMMHRFNRSASMRQSGKSKVHVAITKSQSLRDSHTRSVKARLSTRSERNWYSRSSRKADLDSRSVSVKSKSKVDVLESEFRRSVKRSFQNVHHLSVKSSSTVVSKRDLEVLEENDYCSSISESSEYSEHGQDRY